MQRWRDGKSGEVNSELTYSPGINCINADVIVVHVIFKELYSRVGPELKLRHLPLKSWHIVIHRKLYYRLAMLLETFVYRNQNIKLVAVSSLVANYLKTYFRRNDVMVIPNGVDTTRFTLTKRLARRATARELYRYSERDFVLLLIGNDWNNKGLAPLLRALDLLYHLPLRLLVVGADDPNLFEPWMAEINCRERIRFEVPSIDVLSFYAAADVYVAPSLWDAFGLPITEAMACGLPTIASIYAGASEFITDGETGLLLNDPRDPRQIALLVEKLYRSDSLRQEMGFAASRYVQEHCDWEKNVSRTRDLLETIVRERHR